MARPLAGAAQTPELEESGRDTAQSSTAARFLQGFDELLAGRWPGRLRELLDPITPRPLAIGIHAEIAERLALTANEQRRLRRLLAMWVGRPRYLESLRDRGAVRHDLDGNPVERVSREHEIAARQRLLALRVLRAQRREAEARRVAKAVQRRANGDKPVLRLVRTGR